MFGRRLSNLVTCIVECPGNPDLWEVTWASDGRVPRDFSESSLTSATERAARETASLYAGKSEAATAELQFAIYPWQGNPSEVIFDISGGAGRYEAIDIQSAGINFGAESLEALVAAAEQYVPDTSKAMFRWIRKINTLAAS